MSLDSLFKNTVFLLGAGASHSAGCLMSSNMLEELYDEIKNISAGDEVYGAYKEGFKELYRVIKPSLEYQAELKRIIADNKGLFTPNIEDYILILRKILNIVQRKP